MHSFGVRLKNVKNQPPASFTEPSAFRPQVSAHGLQAGDLLVDLKQVLHGPKRNDDDSKFLAKIESHHVALHQTHALARLPRQSRPLLGAALQHPLGNVQPGYAISCFRQRQRNPPRPATQFKHGIAEFMHCIAIKRYVLRSPAHQRRLVVIIRNESIV